MRRMKLPLLCVIFVGAACAVPCGAEEGERVHRAAPVGAYGGRMNPDVSAVVNLWWLFSDNDENPLRNKLRIHETELAFQAYLYPSIRGDLIIALHEHAGEWEIHPEEAFVSFLDIPGGFQLLAGRKLVDFGRLNPVHPHHWKFADQPLVLDNFFGSHPFYDDGVQIDWLLPNPWDLYCKPAFGYWMGKGSGAGHEQEPDGEGHRHPQTVAWQGRIYNGRAALDLPAGELSNILIGYSIVWDEGSHTILHGGDLTITYRRPMSYKRIKWQSELFYAKTKDESVSDPLGLYSMLAFTLNQYGEVGIRYDRSEYFVEEHGEEEEEEHHRPTRGYGWGMTGFLTYYFTHSLHLRLEYTHSVDRFDREDNQAVMQLVWGLGPHAHRLED